jgi:hypothetical protein
MKPYKTYRTISVLLVLFLICVSCDKDFLSLTPKQSVSFDTFFKSLADFQSAIIGCYDQMQDPDWYGRYMLLVPDIMGDDVKQNSQANRAREWAEYNGSTNSVHEVDRYFWQEIYEAINMANQIINAPFEPAPALQDEYNQIIGEAYAVRALSHFDLVRLFAQHYTYTAGASHPGVPIVTEFDVTSKPARNTVAEVYAQIISDFNEAISLMTIDTGNAGRFSKEAAQALLSRVYLYMEDFANAETMATAVINSGKYALVDSADYATMFFPGLSSEAILEVINIQVDRYAFDHVGYMYQKTGYGDYLPSKDLLNLIDENDVRKTTFVLDPELVGQYGEYRVNKFPSIGEDNGTDNIPVIRLSEVYLNRAEARAKSGNDAGAQDDLNMIRQKRLSTAPDVTATGQALLDEIAIERRVELCFEGHRIFDITRHKQNLVRVDCTAPVSTVTYPDYRFILPIPLVEMDANPNMVQNPGY